MNDELKARVQRDQRRGDSPSFEFLACHQYIHLLNQF